MTRLSRVKPTVNAIKRLVLILFFAALGWTARTAEGSFIAGTPLTTGLLPTAAVSGDFNNDGLLDLAVANYNGNTMTVFLGTGGGAFQPGVSYNTASGPTALAAGHFNSDGLLDLAVANYNAFSVSVFMGVGDGTFQARMDFSTSRFPTGLAVNDYNRDNYQDLAVASSGDGLVSIHRGNNNGTFQARVDFGAGTTPIGLVSGNFNADANPDLAVANFNSNTVSVLIGNGNGTFQAKTDYAVGSQPRAILAADFNNDAIMDLVSANYGVNTVSVLRGVGNGTFTSRVDYSTGSGPYYLAAADFNRDGNQDLAVSAYTGNSISLLLGTGTGLLQPRTDYLVGTQPRGLATGDFNLDLQTDLAVANSGDDTAGILLNNFQAVIPTLVITGKVALIGGPGAVTDVMITLSGDANSVVFPNLLGEYSFTVPSGGSYLVTPTLADYSFAPASRSYTHITTGQSLQDYNGNHSSLSSYQVQGTVTKALDSSGFKGVEVALKFWTGTDTTIVDVTITDTFGNYTLNGFGALGGISYQVVPRAAGWAFTPAGTNLILVDADRTGVDFTAAEATYQISGRVAVGTSASGLLDVRVNLAGRTLSGTLFNLNAYTDGAGNYQFNNIPAGDYNLTPQRTGWIFDPETRPLSIRENPFVNQDFGAYLLITLTYGPVGVPNPVDIGEEVECAVTAILTASDVPPGTLLNYTWRATSGYFDDSGTAISHLQNPIWIADLGLPPGFVDTGLVQYDLIPIQVTVSCLNGIPVTSNFIEKVDLSSTVSVQSADDNCFIATAAFGSPLAREVNALRRFRDTFLLRHGWGRAFVRFYYRHSPPLARFIRPRPFWCAVVRSGLRPVIWLVGHLV
ncbi:MAG TPA: FG-GAP-like repeat-containing protein [bacterium]|uniref:FG-GAP repeat protein n=1 Tax=candidate division TA06 bacterium ADurb.Bin417 TaxID=1852828 RepID=A0A1V5MIH2_UNCT6|nr:MAG: FG-GAP repeat protein [candidate division TA06 bacterium ADurb.Bin417]HNQ34798.1 FG-GAP-like repeat-containing protein [bacterium]HNS48519.1 FG-GAP-like repeat-containing protein [bacterium]